MKKLVEVHNSKPLVQAHYVSMTSEEREQLRGVFSAAREERKKAQAHLKSMDETVVTIKGIEKIVNTVVLPTNDSQDGYDTSSPRSEESVQPVAKQSLLGRVFSVVGSSSSSKAAEKKEKDKGKKRKSRFDTF
jgi:hypothetical protein